MTSVILTRTNTVKLFVVELAEIFTPFGVFPYPIFESLLNKLLFRLCTEP